MQSVNLAPECGHGLDVSRRDLQSQDVAKVGVQKPLVELIQQVFLALIKEGCWCHLLECLQEVKETACGLMNDDRLLESNCLPEALRRLVEVTNQARHKRVNLRLASQSVWKKTASMIATKKDFLHSKNWRSMTSNKLSILSVSELVLPTFRFSTGRSKVG